MDLDASDTCVVLPITTDVVGRSLDVVPATHGWRPRRFGNGREGIWLALYQADVILAGLHSMCHDMWSEE